VTSESLAVSYLKKATTRLKVLALLLEEGSYSDVVREAQELVELALKGMLRSVGIEPPKIHDVGKFLLEHQSRFHEDIRERLIHLAGISKSLRKDLELAFYGDIDFIPTEEYSITEAQQAYDGAKIVLDVATRAIQRSG
jgi:HEPN domain-containing protein